MNGTVKNQTVTVKKADEFESKALSLLKLASVHH